MQVTGIMVSCVTLFAALSLVDASACVDPGWLGFEAAASATSTVTDHFRHFSTYWQNSTYSHSASASLQPGMIVTLQNPQGEYLSGHSSTRTSDTAAFWEHLMVVDAGAGFVALKGGIPLCEVASRACAEGTCLRQST